MDRYNLLGQTIKSSIFRIALSIDILNGVFLGFYIVGRFDKVTSKTWTSGWPIPFWILLSDITFIQYSGAGKNGCVEKDTQLVQI